jgi:hypothetical protein
MQYYPNIIFLTCIPSSVITFKIYNPFASLLISIEVLFSRSQEIIFRTCPVCLFLHLSQKQHLISDAGHPQQRSQSQMELPWYYL